METTGRVAGAREPRPFSAWMTSALGPSLAFLPDFKLSEGRCS